MQKNKKEMERGKNAEKFERTRARPNHQQFRKSDCIY